MGDNSAMMPFNMEVTLQNLEDNFWYILNNPVCFNDIIYKWFNKSVLFNMFPYCEAFLRLYRVTGRTTSVSAMPQVINLNVVQRSTAQTRADGTSRTILEEITEMPEEMELKRGKC